MFAIQQGFLLPSLQSIFFTTTVILLHIDLVYRPKSIEVGLLNQFKPDSLCNPGSIIQVKPHLFCKLFCECGLRKMQLLTNKLTQSNLNF